MNSTVRSDDQRPKFCRNCGSPLEARTTKFGQGFDVDTGIPRPVTTLVKLVCSADDLHDVWVHTQSNAWVLL